MIKAITVDCWGTLFLDGPLSDERYARQRLTGIAAILAASGITVSRQDLNRAYEAAGRRLARLWGECRDVPARRYVTLFVEAIDAKLPERLGSARIDEMLDAYGSPALVVPPALDPGAAAALERLATSGIALAMVSNTMRTPGAVLRRIIDREGILGLFKVLVFSDECGIRKPDPEIFRIALRQLGVAPEEAAHVGDDAVLDVEGARRAGMSVVQICHDGRATGPAKPDAVIAGLAELPAAVASMTSPSARGTAP